MPPKQQQGNPFVMNIPIEGLQQLFGFLGAQQQDGASGANIFQQLQQQQQQQIPQVQHRGVGHLFQGEMNPRAWIDREQRRGQSPALNMNGRNAASTRTPVVEIPLTEEQYRDRGNHAFRVGDLQGALTNYTAALNLNPANEAALTNRATTHFKLKNYESAAADARRAIQIKPDYFKAHYRLGMSLAQLGYFEEALEALKSAEQLAPTEDEKQDIRIQAQKAESRLKTRASAQEDATEKLIQQQQQKQQEQQEAQSQNQNGYTTVPDSPSYASSFPPITPLGPQMGFPADAQLPPGFSTVGNNNNNNNNNTLPTSTPISASPTTRLNSSIGTGFKETNNNNNNPKQPDLVVSLDTVCHLAQEARSWRGLEQEGETFVNDDLVEALSLLSSKSTSDHEKHILQECNPQALQNALDQYAVAQDELRKAAKDSSDREKFNLALQNRDAKLQTALKIASRTEFAAQKLNELRKRNDACRAVIENQLHQLPQKAATTVVNSAALTSTTTTTVNNNNNKNEEIAQLIQEFKNMKKDVAGEVQSAMSRTDRAAAEFLAALQDEQRIVHHSLSMSPSNCFKPLRDISSKIIRAAREKLGTSSPVIPAESVQEIGTLVRRVEADRASLQRATFDGQRYLDLESVFERDRLSFERQRIQMQAELDWLLVKEEEDQRKLDSLRRNIERVKENSTAIAKKQHEVQQKILQLIETDLPELAWKAAAGGKKILKWAKGSGYWVNLSLADFEIVRTLATTPSSKVLQARSKRDGTIVAIKEVQVETEALRRRFQNEVNVVTGLASHKNVLHIQGVFFDGPFAYIVMPFYALGSLLDFMKKGEALKTWRIQELMRQIVSGVATLHEQGVVHADIKPGNILLGPEMTPTLADFGLARDVGRLGERCDVTIDTSNHRGLTENFAAPELLNPNAYIVSDDEKRISPLASAVAAGKPTMRSDIYSLGISLLQLAANNHKALEEEKQNDQRRRQIEIEEREERAAQRAREAQQAEVDRLREQLRGIPGVNLASPTSTANNNNNNNSTEAPQPITPGVAAPFESPTTDQVAPDQSPAAASANTMMDNIIDAEATNNNVPASPNSTTSITPTTTTTNNNNNNTAFSPSASPTTRGNDLSRALILHPTHQQENYQILFPQAAAGKTVDPKVVGDDRLADLLTEMISLDPSSRPTAQEILAHPYFSVSLLEESVKSHQLEESNQKLEALSAHIHALRAIRRNPVLISVERNQMVESVSSVVSQLTDEAMLNPLFVVFRGEEGLDEGGLTGEMIQMYFMQAITNHRLLVCSSAAAANNGNEGSSSCSVVDMPMEREATSAPTATNNNNDNDTSDDPTSASSPTTENNNINNVDSSSTTVEPSPSDRRITPGDPEVMVDTPYLPSDDRLIPRGLFDTMGRMLLKALIENRPIPILLSNVVFKHIIGLRPNMLDLEEYDRSLWRSLRQLQYLSSDELEGVDVSFDEFPAAMLTQDLKFDPSICSKTVAPENVKDYIAAKAYHVLVYSRKAALDAIKAGFFSCEPLKPHLQLMSPVELQIALCGQQHITGRDVIALLDFINFPSNSNTPKYFVESVTSMSQNNLRRLLRLCTSSVTIPRGGAGRSARIRIFCTQDTARLPVGHTCINQLDLPNYDDKEKFNKMMALALAHAEDGFFVM